MAKTPAHTDSVADAGKARLRRALAGDDGGLSHAEAQAQLPAYIEAERLGLPVTQQFPALTTHLDTCPICAQEYVELVEIIAWREEEAPPLAPAQAQPPNLWFLQPRAERLRQAVTTMTQTLVQTLLPRDQQRRLRYQLNPFFDRIAQLGGQFRLAQALAPQPLALDEGGTSPSADLLMATYLAAEALGRLLPAAVWAAQPLSAETVTLIRQEAKLAAQTVGLKATPAQAFAEHFTTLVLNDVGLLVRSAPLEDA